MKKLNCLIFNKITLLICLALWVAFQVWWVVSYPDGEQVNDAGRYLYYAKQCIDNNTWYPDINSYHDKFIHNPGWINFIILWLRLFGDIKLLPCFGIIINTIVLILLYKICMEVFQKKEYAFVAIYLFMLIPAYPCAVTHTYSELQFGFLSMLAFYLILKKNYLPVAISGIIVALANWTRPLALAWIISGCVFLLIECKSIRKCIVYIGMVILTSVSIAVSSKKYFPDMVYSANTTGVNMIMSAYDKAFGGFDDRVFEEGEIGYLPGAVDSTRIPVRRYPGAELIYQTTDRYLYKEYDAFYKERAMDWIKHNPIKWLGMMPKKFAIAYCDTDYFSFSVNEDATDYRKLPSIMKFWNIVFAEWLWRVMVGLALLGLMTPFWRNNRIIYLYSTIALCTGATLLSAALPRYNFPMITMVVLLCVYTVKFYASRLSHNSPQ